MIPTDNREDSVQEESECEIQTSTYTLGNPFSEIVLLCQHTDIVRHLVCIDSVRYCSAGDDGVIVVWNVETGAVLHTLRGHSRPITCLCPVVSSDDNHSDHFLLSASSDRLVCMWNINTGEQLKKYSEHNSTIKCIVPLPSGFGLFCFAGEKLCLWSISDGQLNMIPVNTRDAIQFLLTVRDNILVSAADTQIAVYKYSFSTSTKAELDLVEQFELHRESIRSLVKVNEFCFVSGSLDGTILQWSVDSLTVTQKYNIIEDYQGLSRTYPFSVQHLLPLHQRYLFCAQGCSLYIYDTKSCRLLLKQNDLHESKVLHLQFICSGYFLATASEDSNIKLWRCMTCVESSTKESSDDGLRTFSECLDFVTEPGEHGIRELSLILAGECQAHSAAVQMCLDVPPNRFLSCGVDHAVILWKNSIVEACKRHRTIRDTWFGLDLSTEDLSSENS